MSALLRHTMRSRKLINLISDSATQDSPGRYRFPISLPSQHRFNRICLVRAMLPKSWYIVQEGQNRLVVREGITDTAIHVPPGNYNRKSLAVDIANLLTTSSPNGLTYTMTYPNAMIHGDDGKYTFTVATAAGAVPAEPIAITVPEAKESNLFELFGFVAGSTNEFVNGTLRSVNVVKIQAEDTVRVHCNVCDNNGDDVLTEIYALSNPTYSNIVYECPDILAYSKPLTNRTTTSYEFRFTNEADLPLRLNGLNFCFEILLFEEPEPKVPNLL